MPCLQGLKVSTGASNISPSLNVKLIEMSTKCVAIFQIKTFFVELYLNRLGGSPSGANL